MANTDDVNPARSIYKVGDVAYKRAVSEALLSKMAQTSNHIAKFQTDYASFFLNGSYSVSSGLFGYDGAYTGFYNFEIVGVQIWNAISGSSGITELSVHWIDQSGVDQGSIFTTTPKIDSTSSNGTRGFRNLETGNDYTMPGVTLPVLSKTEFLEGETLYLVIDNAMNEAQNAALTLFLRPR